MPAPNVMSAVRRFTETTGAGTYRASVVVPPGNLIRSVRAYNRVAWTAASSAALTVGTAVDGTELLGSSDLKTAMVIFDATIADLDTAQPTLTAGVTVFMKVVTVGATGAAGQTELVVEYEKVPETPIAATKV